MNTFRPTQTFDGLAPTTAKGDLIARDSSTNVRVAVGADGQVLQADTTATSGVKWATPSNGAVRSVTTTDAPTTADGTLILSGASFTVTLFTAVGNSGKTINIIHGGTSLSQIFTLNTTSSQTIGGIASGSYALYTNGESLGIRSDGANWVILDHKADTSPVSWTPTFTNLGTVTAINMQSWRQGQYLHFTGQWTNGTVIGTKCSFTIGFDGANAPSGLTIDTNIVPTTANSVRGTGANFNSNNTAAAWGVVVADPATSTSTLYFNLVNGSGYATGSALGTGSLMFLGMGRIPITGWRP